MSHSWIRALSGFYRVQSSGTKVSALRPLGYTVLGTLMARPDGNEWRLALLNLIGIAGLLLFFGAYGNCCDWRLQGERNSTQAALAHSAFLRRQKRFWLALPLALSLGALLSGRGLGLSPAARACWLWILFVGVAYIMPGLRLKVHGGFILIPFVACALFLEAYLMTGRTALTWGGLAFCAVLGFFQAQAELLHLLEDRVREPQEPQRMESQHMLAVLRWVQRAAWAVSVVSMLGIPWFFNSALWAWCRHRWCRRAGVERLLRWRHQWWHPIWSLQEFAICALLGPKLL